MGGGRHFDPEHLTGCTMYKHYFRSLERRLGTWATKRSSLYPVHKHSSRHGIP